MSEVSQSQPVSASNGHSDAAPSAASIAFQCAVSADLVRRALLATGENATRFYLAGVHITPHPRGGALIVATDGFGLLCFHDPSGIVTGEGIISPDEVTRAALDARRGDKGPRILFGRKDRLHVAIASPDSADVILDEPNPLLLAAQYREPTIGAAYPAWHKIMTPIEPTGALTRLDARRLNKLAKALSRDKVRGVQLYPADTDGRSVWIVGQIREGIGLLAQMRDGSSAPAELPGWMVGDKGFLPADPASSASCASPQGNSGTNNNPTPGTP